MKSWQKGVLLILLAMFIAGGAGWWWVSGDIVTVRFVNTTVVFKNSQRIGKAMLKRESIRQLLEKLEIGEEKYKIVFNFEEYKDQDFSGMMALMKGSIISVGTMMCSKPVDKNIGTKTVTVYTSAKVFADKYGENVALERENNLVVMCLLRTFNASDELITKVLLEQKISIVSSLNL